MKNGYAAFTILTMLVISIVLTAPPGGAVARAGGVDGRDVSSVTAAPSQAPSSDATPRVRSKEPAQFAAPFPSYVELEARYPQSDAVILYDSLLITWDEGNRISRRYHRAVMLFTDNAINRYGDPRILFNSATQDLVVTRARVYMRDGTIVDTQKNGVNQTTPFALALTTDYDDWQEMVVTHVGIEKGCVAELGYAISDKAPSPWLSGVEIFGPEDPTQVRVLEIRVPPSTRLKFVSQNGVPGPESSSDGVWRWAVENIPGRTPQNGGAWEGDFLPVVCYSTAENWEQVFQSIASRMEAASAGKCSFDERVLDSIKNLQTDEDRILAVHRLALECVSDVHAPFGCFAETPRSAEGIYASGYATNLDRAVLLAAMIKAIGYWAEPYFVSLGRFWDSEVPSPEICGVMVGVWTEGGEGTTMLEPGLPGHGMMMLDPNAPYEHGTLFTHAGRTFFGCKHRSCGAEAIEGRKGRDSASELDLDLKKGADGTIEGEGRALLTGLFSPYCLMRGAGTEAEDFVKARVNGLFEGAELTSWNPSSMGPSETEFAFSFSVKLPDKKSGERVYLTMPRPFEAALSGIDRVHVERSSSSDAIKVEPCALEISCWIEAPEGWKIISLPQPGEEKNEIGSALVAIEHASERKSVCRRSLGIKADLVRPADYSALRSLILTFDNNRIVLERE
jgi:hypothetical protein